MNQKDNIETILGYLFSFFLLLTCNTVFFNINKSSILILIMLAILVFLCVVQFIKYKEEIKLTFIMMLLIYLFFQMIYLFFSGISKQNLVEYIFIFYIFFPISLCVVYFNQLGIIKKLVNLLTIMAVLSLLLWLLGSILNFIPVTSQVFLPWSNGYIKSYFWGLHYDTQLVRVFGVLFTRNSGLYAEAPIYGYVLSAGLLSNILLLNKNIDKKNIIFIITILTTGSTTAILIGLLSIGYLIMGYNSDNLLVRFMQITGIVIAVVLIVVIARTLILEKTGTYSYSIRNDDIAAGLASWRLHPLIGNGFNNTSVLISNMAFYRAFNSGALAGFSSGLLTILSDGGILFVSVYVLPIIIAIKRNDPKKFILYSVLLVILFFSITQYTYLTLFLIAIGIAGNWRTDDD